MNNESFQANLSIVTRNLDLVKSLAQDNGWTHNETLPPSEGGFDFRATFTRGDLTLTVKTTVSDYTWRIYQNVDGAPRFRVLGVTDHDKPTKEFEDFIK